jgi:hypothetical protein
MDGGKLSSRLSVETMIRWLALVLLLVARTATAAAPQWLTLPPTPTLPTPERSGLAPVNGIKIWYAVFGAGRPVILLHGQRASPTPDC